MNKKIQNYIDVLFADVPRSKKASELKEELLSNMNERFEDYMRQGKTETQSYSLVVASMGEVDSLIAEVMPDADFKQEAQKYRLRNARNTSIGVSMYIIGAAFVVGFGVWSEYSKFGDLLAMTGVVILLLLSAIATALIVYSNMSTPQEYKDYDQDEQAVRNIRKSPNGKLYDNIMSIYWSIITVIYLGISFITGSWNISWIIWPLAGVFSKIIQTLFEMRNTND